MKIENELYELTPEQRSWVGRVLGFCIYNKLVVALVTLFVIGWGIYSAPFDWEIFGFERSPVAVDAIPDIGENQQIVFTDWPGRSPQDIENQVTYPLTTALLGIPDIKVIRSSSMFGFSSIYIIFEDFSPFQRLIHGKNFYWTRSRVLEKLNSLPPGTLPQGVVPMLGPDATALGQIFWYTLEGRDKNGNAAGGWDLEELRTIEDWQVRQRLRSAGGVSEVASIGGFVREYQVDVDPDAMRAFNVSIDEVFAAVQQSNMEVGAQTIEINRVEYLIRGLGFIKSVEDIEQAVIKSVDNVPVLVKNVAHVSWGPQVRLGALDKAGAPAVGGVVVARYGSNPLDVIKNVKQKIEEITPGLPSKTLADGTVSKIEIVPFYDRTGLIYETLGTLNDALYQEMLVTVIVIIIVVRHLRSSILISSVMPLAVLFTFITMKLANVDANIVSLSGIAIAVGTIVDMGIVICENILKHLDEDPPEMPRAMVIHRAASEVGSSVLAACASTIISFLPIFAMSGAEGKLFKPLAFTKTFALAASIIIALTIIPSAAHLLFFPRGAKTAWARRLLYLILALLGLYVAVRFSWLAGLAIVAFALYYLVKAKLPSRWVERAPWVANIVVLILVAVLLTANWHPLGVAKGLLLNLLFVVLVIGGLMTLILLFQHFYERILGWCLEHKLLFLSMPAALLVLGAFIWFGFDRLFGFVLRAFKSNVVWSAAAHTFPGLGREFMPPLDEGSFLLMPTTMAHASIGEALDIVQKQDAAISSIPEIELAVGKIGRTESALDPAPVGMIETIIQYKSEYIIDEDGRRITFKYDKKKNEFVRDSAGSLIRDPDGRPYRQWRNHIRTPDDIWEEIIAAAQMPGTTSAPKLQPIAARLVMLQSGMRAPMGIKVKGPDLQTIEKVGLELEKMLKQTPGVEPATVIADRIIGKPYLEIVPDRAALARYGLSIEAFQNTLEIAVGGIQATTTVEGRYRFPVRVRYMRELRGRIESLERILVAGTDGAQVPLLQVASIQYIRGPEVIKSEDTALVGYVLFDKKEDFAEVDVVENANRMISQQEAEGAFVRPAGVDITFAGTYENQIRASKTLMVLVPISLFSIFLVLYFQFRAVSTTLMVFVGVLVSWSGAFLLIWLYAQPWFMNFSMFGVGMRELFQIHPINLSVAVWVGFLALFGISDDDGVLMATYLDQSFGAKQPQTIDEIRRATLFGGQRRVRAALMTTATTILALIPIFTSIGRGSDIMVPMAIPSFGGMTIQIMTMLIVPVLYSSLQERRLRKNTGKAS
ncbi:MAG: efflux RND transporter permease subunit [Planctomycetaceae bacterium]|nr:efflux RND transporter permease subunit [Planctomycetaceae bacterium]